MIAQRNTVFLVAVSQKQHIVLTPQRPVTVRGYAPLLSILVVTSGYCASFAPLYTQIGYGRSIGFLAGMLAFVLNALLFTSVGEAGWMMMSREDAPGIAVVIALGVAIGQMHDHAIHSSKQLAYARAECIQLTDQRPKAA